METDRGPFNHPHPRSLSPQELKIRALSDRLVQAQRPLRILNAVRWDDGIAKSFFARDGREMPPVAHDYYQARPLPFDPDAKLAELAGIERDVHRQLGRNHAVGRILVRMGREYGDVVRLLLSRGTPAFGEISRRLFGSSQSGPAASAKAISHLLDRVASPVAGNGAEPTWGARQTVQALATRLQAYFQNGCAVRVKLSGTMVADAAAGSAYIKVREGARFTPSQVRLLEVHEGWVHLGTTLNGQQQPVCTFLAKGPPSSTRTQEGLAVLTEVLAQAASPERAQRLARRIQGVALAEAGANFLEVYRSYLDMGCDRQESYRLTVRVFRGGLPEGSGPFTKDLCYGHGFAQVLAFVRQAVETGTAYLVPLLFCGKTALADVQAIAQLVDEGLVVPPRYVPPPLTDRTSLMACMENLAGTNGFDRGF